VCNAEAPSVEEAAQKYGDTVQFVGVAWTGSDDDFQEFTDRYSLSFPQLSDDPGDIFARFGVPSQPAWVFVDSSGETQQLLNAAEEELLASILDNLS
jgi:peroxiredoxin